MTELEAWQPQPQPPARPSAAAALVEWADAARAAHLLAESLVKTQVCPEHFRGKAAEATSVIIAGAELGLSPIASLRSMYVIKGQIGVYTRTQVGLAQSHGHKVWTEYEDDRRVVVCGHRAGDGEHVERVEWTIERAKLAGLVRKNRDGSPGQYETQPRAMLWARAAGDVARRIAADVLQGVPEGDEPPAAPMGAQGGTRRVVEQYRGAAPIPVGEVLEAVVADVERGTVDPAAPLRPVAPEEPGPGGPAPDAAPDRPSAPPSVDEQPRVSQPKQPTLVDVELPPAGPPGPEPQTEAQRRNIMTTLNAHRVNGHDARVAWLTEFLGRPIASSTELTKVEASAVLDHLEWEGHVDD